MTTSLVQIFEVSDARAQELIVGLLAGVDDVEATPASSGLGLLVTTACADANQAHWVSKLVTSIDFDAELVYSNGGPPEPLAA